MLEPHERRTMHMGYSSSRGDRGASLNFGRHTTNSSSPTFHAGLLGISESDEICVFFHAGVLMKSKNRSRWWGLAPSCSIMGRFGCLYRELKKERT